jgi:hypothetical protein
MPTRSLHVSAGPLTRSLICALAALAAVVALGTGCATRTHRASFYEDTQTRILFRHQTKGRNTLERGYSHPLAIAPVRLAHILSRIDVRTEAKKGAQRASALPTAALYVLADHLSRAFAQAGPNQEIAVYYTRRHKRWGVFDHRYLTSFVTYAQGDTIFLHLSRTDWEIEKKGKQERLPEPVVGKHPMDFKVIPSQGMVLVDSQSLAIDWQHSVFKRPTRTRITPSGEVVRRTILMESPEEDIAADAEPAFERLPQDLSAATLRDLADLEDERNSGDITEADYNARRREIIRSDPAAR